MAAEQVAEKEGGGSVAAGKKIGVRLWKKWREAFPVNLFFLLVSVFILRIFGTEYALTIAAITVLFQSRMDRENTPSYFLRLLVGNLLLCLLGIAATLNIFLCVLLNLAVPFTLVLLQSDQFTPKGYFPYAMCFAFQELRPPEPSAYGTQLLVMALCTLAAILALEIYADWSSRPEGGIQSAQECMDILAGLLERMARGEKGEALSRELYELEKTLHGLAHLQRTSWSGGDGEQIFDLLGTLVQRAAYLSSDAGWQEGVLPPEWEGRLLDLAGLVREAGNEFGREDREALIRRAQTLLETVVLPDGRLRIFYRGFLRILILVLQRAEAVSEPQPLQTISWGLLRSRLQDRLRLDSIQGRFALRLAVVMTISFTVSMLWDVERSYWFPLHAFLLLQPSYEDSAHRMRTRPIGTAIGCLVVALVYPHLPGTIAAFLFAFFMGVCLHCATPGTWYQPIFSTSFALTLASMTSAVPVLVYYRIFCLLLAIALVLVINRFLLPTRKVDQLRMNVKTLFLLHRHYWDIIRVSLRETVDLTVTSAILTQFHLIYDESLADLTQSGLPDQAPCRELLLTMWNLFAELEQMEYCIQTGLVEQEEYLFLDALAEELGDQVYPPQSGLLELAPQITFQGELMNDLFQRYMENISKMIRLYGSDACRELQIRPGFMEEVLTTRKPAAR